MPTGKNIQIIESQFYFGDAFKNLIKFEEVTEAKYPDIQPIYIRRTLLKAAPEKIIGLKVTIEVQSE